MKNSFALALVLASFLTVSAHADNFRKKHPRRAEVNSSVRKERREVKKDVASGKITAQQGAADLQAVNAVKKEERADVKANGGHLTRAEQKSLNGELRADQKQIKSQVNGNAQPVAPAAPASN